MIWLSQTRFQKKKAHSHKKATIFAAIGLHLFQRLVYMYAWFWYERTSVMSYFSFWDGPIIIRVKFNDGSRLKSQFDTPHANALPFFRYIIIYRCRKNSSLSRRRSNFYFSVDCCFEVCPIGNSLSYSHYSFKILIFENMRVCWNDTGSCLTLTVLGQVQVLALTMLLRGGIELMGVSWI